VRPVVAIRHHMPHELGVAAEVFDELAVPYRYLDAWSDPAWPALDEVSAVVVLGGEMNADETARHPFLGRERELLRRAVDREVPVLGICLGAQLLARALDARVPRSPVPELGFHEIRLTDAGRDDEVLAPFESSPSVFQWHGDTFDVPRGAQLLGTSAKVPNQAFRAGTNAYAVQFHPEPTVAGIQAWCARWADDIRSTWGTTPEAVMDDVHEHHPAQRKAAREMFRAFSGLLSDRA
jgi:GMP synthase (glutamine-hydrolysing)